MYLGLVGIGEKRVYGFIEKTKINQEKLGEEQ